MTGSGVRVTRVSLLAAAADDFHRQLHAAKDALRDIDKLAAVIIEHEGHDDIVVCLEEVVATARTIQTVARRVIGGDDGTS